MARTRADRPSRRSESALARAGRCCWPLVVGLCLTVPVFASGQGEPAMLDAARSTARKEYVQDLKGLANWANSSSLFQERDRIWRQVLELDAQDIDARKALKYVRQTDGTWRESPPRKVENMNVKALPELHKRALALGSALETKLLAALAATASDEATRAAVFAEILSLAPDAPRVHELQGEAQLDGHWVLQDTVHAKAHRVEMRALAKSARETAPAPITIEPSAKALVLRDAWPVSVATPDVHVLATTTIEEATDIVRTLGAARTLVESLLGEPVPLPMQYTIYVLGTTAERDALIDRIPGLMLDERTPMKALVSAGLPHTYDVGLWDAERSKRLDACVRHTLGHLLAKGTGVTSKLAWAYEGLGVYLTRELVGTRFTSFAGSAPGGDALRTRLMNPEVNWMSEALSVLSGATHPSLETMLDSSLATLDAPTLLVSYAFCAYLLEARPDLVAVCLRSAAAGAKGASLVNEHFTLTPGALEQRILRWLSERR